MDESDSIIQQSVDDRLTVLEDQLGVSRWVNSSRNLNDELIALEKTIIYKGYGFVTKISLNNVRKLYNLSKPFDYVTFREKCRTIEYEHDVIIENARLLSEFQAGSELLLDSKVLAVVANSKPKLEASEVELKEAAIDFQNYQKRVTNLKECFTSLLNELQSQVITWQTELDSLENQKKLSDAG